MSEEVKPLLLTPDEWMELKDFSLDVECELREAVEVIVNAAEQLGIAQGHYQWNKTMTKKERLQLLKTMKNNFQILQTAVFRLDDDDFQIIEQAIRAEMVRKA